MGESRSKRVLVMPKVYVVFQGDTVMKAASGKWLFTESGAKLMRKYFAKRMRSNVKLFDIRKFKLEEVNGD